MNDERFTVRLSKEEKKQLDDLVRTRGMSTNDYVKYRLFYNNPELPNQEYIYEHPSLDKHHYLTMGMLHDIYYMLSNLVRDEKDEEESREIVRMAHKRTKEKLASHGYMKIQADA